MNYGTSSYGSAALGSSPGSEWFIFFALLSRAAGTYEATLEFTGAPTLYSIFVKAGTDGLFEPFTHNDPAETPQSQGTFSGDFGSMQYVISSARFITLRVTMPAISNFSAHGRIGD